MASLSLKRLVDFYHGILEKGDPHVSYYLMMDSPIPVLAILAIYLCVVVKGPKWMEPHKPWSLRTTLMIYNYILAIISSTISIATLVGLYITWDPSILCYGMENYAFAEDSAEYMTVGWCFTMTKVVELLDTIFFVLRKKNNQISFLHVYHHVTATLLCWLGFKFLPAESNVLYPMLNSCIHAVMYTYYGLSAIGPEARKFLWWKKYITIMQIVQLSIFLLHIILSMLFGCPSSKGFTAIVWLFIFTNLLLFAHFYVTAYGRPVQESRDVKEHLAHTDSRRGEILNGETNRGEILNGDTNRGEILNCDTSRGELLNADTIRGEILNDDTNRGEILNDDTNRGEILNCDTSRWELLNGDTNRGEILNGDTNRGEILNGDINKNQSIEYKKDI